MTQFTTISIVNLHIFTLLILLLIFANNHKISANSIRHIDDYLPQPSRFDASQSSIYLEPDNLSQDSNNDETGSSNFWSRLFRPSYIQSIPKYDVRRGVIHIIPYKKRTIPLELQKALYAHGIVGRRR